MQYCTIMSHQPVKYLYFFWWLRYPCICKFINKDFFFFSFSFFIYSKDQNAPILLAALYIHMCVYEDTLHTLFVQNYIELNSYITKLHLMYGLGRTFYIYK